MPSYDTHNFVDKFKFRKTIYNPSRYTPLTETDIPYCGTQLFIITIMKEKVEDATILHKLSHLLLFYG